MRLLSRISFFFAAIAAVFLTGCGGGGGGSAYTGGNYHVVAHRPHNPDAVHVKVSLSKQNIYVMEGDRCLMAVACTVGIPAKPTPKGNFRIYAKEEHKRSGS
ncbi:MAG: L,D-transpeptidase, partial [Chthoniobacterales bacterium]